MITLLSALLVFVFIAYHYTYFSYCTYIFNINKFPKFEGIACGLINFSFWLVYIFYVPINFEAAAILLYAFLLLIEAKIVFKANFIQMLFISITFTINLFAKRLAVLAIVALLNNGIIVDVMNDVEYTILVAIICFAVSVSTIGFARKTIPRNSLDTILSDNKNLAFLTMAYSILFFTLFAFLLTIDVDAGRSLLYHYAILGLVTINAFAVFIIFAYNLAELRIQTETYKRLSLKNTEDLEKIKNLEQVAIRDTLTYLYTRDYADELIQKMIDDKEFFFVAFVDLDGLKTVNDVHGHEEGDFYIKTVADILQDYFKENTVCRYGGDEVVIVGTCKAEDETVKKLVQSYKAVVSIPKQYNKTYTTSISYGVAFKRPNEVITASELIAVSDSRMYELKKSNKKHRKVVSVKA